MAVKRLICFSLSWLILLCIFSGISSVSAGSGAEPVYATLVTASDFQGGDIAYSNFTAMLETMEDVGHNRPDGFLLGGDYGDEAAVDSDASVNRLMSLLRNRYTDFLRENVIITRGNHDEESSALNPTGLNVFSEYLVYCLDFADYPDGQYWREDCAAKVRQTAQELENCLNELAEAGERRPIFVLSHVPLHHSARSHYGENLYSKYLFDVLNTMGKRLDLIFLFGHDHSLNYDNYIGGSVNLIKRGENIRIPKPHAFYQGEAGYTNETLHFTYANYGYVGYNKNASNEFSTNVLTAGLWEIRPTDIRLYRYTKDGLYSEHTIVRSQPSVASPYVSLEEDLSLPCGSVTTVSATVSNFSQPVYDWSVDDPNVADVCYTGAQAQIHCRNEGSAMLTLTVRDESGTVVTDTLCIRVTASQEQKVSAELRMEERPVNNRKVYFYAVEAEQEVSLDVEAMSAPESVCSWDSSDLSVATVENGVIRFHSEGEAEISFSIDGEVYARTAFMISFEPKPTFELEETDGGLHAGADGVSLTGWHTLLNGDGTTDTYYFDPATGLAADGICFIDGHSYEFTQHVLTRGDLCTDENGSFYFWAGAPLKNRWFSIGEDRYYAMGTGYLATGLQWVLTPDGEEYAPYIFNDNGVFREDLSGLYLEGSDTYYVRSGALVEEAGLIYCEGYYYFFPGSSKAVKNTGYWVYKTNGILPEDYYYFDAEGRMIDPPEIYYEITWIVDGEKNVERYRSGETPIYSQGKMPEKAPNEAVCYSFTGWEPQIGLAIADAAYTAVFEAKEHSLQTEEVPATCTTDGWEQISCTSCGYVTSKTVFAAVGHSDFSTKVPATCTEGGYTSHLCTGCGRTYFTGFTAPTGHINLHAVICEPTCTEFGSITFTCACGKIMGVHKRKPLGHSYTHINMGEYHIVSCTAGCGTSFDEFHRFKEGHCICGALQPQPVNRTAIRVVLAYRPIDRIMPVLERLKQKA